MPDPRDRCFEDFSVGERFEPVAALAGPFGGLVASGWHTAGLTMRLMVDLFLSPRFALGSPGLDELRFPAPVRPGTTLSVSPTIADFIASRSKPDRGIVKQFVEVHDEAGMLVFSVLATAFRRRGPTP